LRLSKKFVWKCQYAVRIKRKGKARGGIITGVKKGIEDISRGNKSDRQNAREKAEGATLENNNDL